MTAFDDLLTRLRDVPYGQRAVAIYVDRDMFHAVLHSARNDGTVRAAVDGSGLTFRGLPLYVVTRPWRIGDAEPIVRIHTEDE